MKASGTRAHSPADLIAVPEVARRLGARFAGSGHELYLVGGTVRDALLGRADSDLDFTTDARPEQVLAIVEPLGPTWTTGMEFGTVGVQLGERLCEITTFRADRYDRVSRRPEVVYGDSLTADLLRRDFTMNAMALSLTGGDGQVFSDPYGGLADLARGQLRTPAPPQESFADDPLRMLRAARFVSTLGVSVAEEVRAAMTGMAGQLGRVSAERVQTELTKLLLGAHPRDGLELLVDTGLAAVVLPELPALRMAVDEHGQHKDVYAHTLQVLEQAIDLEDPQDGPDAVLRWAALLHDIGKPATRVTGTDGRVSFHHHEVVGAKLARRRLRELRFGKQFVEDVSQLVFLHLRFYGYRTGEWTDSAVRRYVVDAGPLLPRLHRLVRSDCTTRNRRKAAALSLAYDTLERRIGELQRQEELDAIRPDLDGNAIMKVLGIGPGRVVGEAYRYLLALRMERGPLGTQAAEQELRRWWEQRSAGS
ncbi:MAG: CCA tRNA nucleotidyltransferase [Jatrophihabitans sp.]|nr:MAG: CCA tRNA nucleotidyltransferase [Jatrophihabitans sp.]